MTALPSENPSNALDFVLSDPSLAPAIVEAIDGATASVELSGRPQLGNAYRGIRRWTEAILRLHDAMGEYQWRARRRRGSIRFAKLNTATDELVAILYICADGYDPQGRRFLVNRGPTTREYIIDDGKTIQLGLGIWEDITVAVEEEASTKTQRNLLLVSVIERQRGLDGIRRVYNTTYLVNPASINDDRTIIAYEQESDCRLIGPRSELGAIGLVEADLPEGVDIEPDVDEAEDDDAESSA